MEFRTVLTTCPYCGCGCGLLLEVLDGKLIGTLPSKTSPVNEGRLCVKGWTVHEFVMSPNRLTQPLVRKGEGLHESSWNEALSLAATRLKEIKEKYGPDSIAVLTSAKCTNEENYLLQKFRKGSHWDEQHRSLRPPLTLLHGGRAGRGVWQRGNDQLH